jgi:hypothetical protein
MTREEKPANKRLHLTTARWQNGRRPLLNAVFYGPGKR